MKAVPGKSSDDKIEKLKIPPHSMEAEQSVLGSMLIAPDSWDKVAEIVIEEDFYNRSHRTIYRGIIRLLQASKPVDIITVSEELESYDELEEAGGFTYLGELAQNTPSAGNVVAYAEIIKERAITRELISVAHNIADVGYNPEGRDSSEILDLAETQVFEIAEKRTGANEGPKNIESVLGKTIDRLEKLIKTNKEVTGVSTGYTDLDKKTSGLQPSDLIIVAARPSMGKCIVSGSTLVNPETGALHTIDECVKARHANVLSIDNQFKTVSTSASEFVDDGVKPVFKVTTALGKTIETTLTHPFLTGTGWLTLEVIKQGDLIALPRALPVFGTTSVSEHEVKAIGYMISDGSTTNGSPTFTNVSNVIVTDFISAMTEFSGVKVKAISAKSRAQSYRVVGKSTTPALIRSRFAQRLNQSMQLASLSGKMLANKLGLQSSTISLWRNAHTVPMPAIYSDVCDVFGDDFRLSTDDLFNQCSTLTNTVTQFLQQHGLMNKLAYEKVLPDCVFTWSKDSIALLLNRMFACDGSIFIQRNQQASVSYATSSETLSVQVQHLLLRFGIVAKKRQKPTRYHNAHSQFEVEVLDRDSILKFVEQIGALSKENIAEEVTRLLREKQPHTNFDVLPESVNQYILKLKGDRSWQYIFNLANIAMPTGYNPHLVGISERGISRDRVALFAELFNDQYLYDLSKSDVYWDKVVSIEYQGYKQVFDLTVPEYHNFIAQDVFVHNTTFAMNLCENAMLLEEKPVLVFSLEMPAEQIMMRMLASLSRVDQTKIRTAQLDDEDWARISNTMAMLKDKDNLFIDDSSGLTPMELRTRARKLAREHGGISMIMIDYLQLMRVPSISENRTLEIAEISRSLKALAKELEVPVVALSQLNRGLEQRADKRPINSDLRESGSIEQDADLIMFIYRDEVYNENTELKGVSEIILGKQRNGPIGTVRLTFQGEYSRFDNYAGPAYSDE